ncbi:endospore germination permease [Paenibacillus melissococcoides]|uniref:Endospore germination permease n=1 Tax=Paenibacillus melissococcoides TaxID=2912268 RepID=A0ABN8UF56_9BACL|nr:MULTISPECIES: endospore germination permease [Paenibacillus]MEB9894637.1 endospore germination permease [Bacillus cereus]CAH8248899.1 endospore germination permease [Paenibacillus melissococcoides]CAH8720729.1 endospore germination permease [Paenibacillus melissococcoides]CAH8720917.1 endospore germination permease [Paenibacillus melissococcoides]
MNPVKINLRQFKILVILFTVGTTILITPAGLAAEIGQDAWMAPIAAMAPGLLLVLLYNGIHRAAPGMTIVEISESLFGTWIGKGLALLFVLFSFFAAALVLFDVGQFIITVLMPETPLPFVNALFALLLLYAIGSGFDTLARMTELLFPWFALLFLFMVALMLPQIDVRNVQPFLEAGPKELAHSVLVVLSLSYMPLAVFLMIQPVELTNARKAPRAFAGAVLIGGILSSVVTALTILVLGANVTSLQEYPVYSLAQRISIGKFLERVEAIAAGLWLITTFMKMSLYFYASVSGLVRLARLPSHRGILLPMVALLVVISVKVFPNSAAEYQFTATIWIIIVFTAGVAIPLLLFIGLMIKRRTHEGGQ